MFGFRLRRSCCVSDSVSATAGQWVLGFVSAANQYSTVPPAKAEAREMARWVDDYCREHAESDVAEAAKGLVELLLAGRQP